MGSAPALTDIIRHKVLGLRNIMTTAVVVDKGDTVEIRTKRNEYLVFLFVCIAVIRPSQPIWVMSSKVSLPYQLFLGQVQSSR